MLKVFTKFKLSPTFLGLFLFFLYVILSFYLDDFSFKYAKKNLIQETRLISQDVLLNLSTFQERIKQLRKDTLLSLGHFHLIDARETIKAHTQNEQRKNKDLALFMEKILRANQDFLDSFEIVFHPDLKRKSLSLKLQNASIVSKTAFVQESESGSQSTAGPRVSWDENPQTKGEYWGLKVLSSSEEKNANTQVPTYSYPLIERGYTYAYLNFTFPLSWIEDLLIRSRGIGHELFLATQTQGKVRYLAKTFENDLFNASFLQNLEEGEMNVFKSSQERHFLNIKAVSDSSWILAVSFDESQITSISYSMKIQILLLFVASFFILVAIIYFASKGILKRDRGQLSS